MSITTPVNAQKAGDLTATQIETLRTGLAISDMPILADRTYIVFDATVGDNNLYLDTGATATDYSITKGDGTFATNYNDTGGTKVLNYTVAGRYMITIVGDFAGVKTATAVTADKEKYIKIIGGSNHPTTIDDYAFSRCTNLVYAEFPNVDDIGIGGFQYCDELLFLIVNSLSGLDDNVLVSTDKVIVITSDSISTTSKKIGLGVAEPTEDLDVLGNINVSGSITSDSINADEANIDSITVSGNIGTNTLSSTGNITEKGETLEAKYAQLNETVDFGSIKEGGVLLIQESIQNTLTASGLAGTGWWQAHSAGNIVTINFYATNSIVSPTPTTITISAFGGSLPVGMRPTTRTIAQIQPQGDNSNGKEITISTTGVIALYDDDITVSHGYVNSVTFARD